MAEWEEALVVELRRSLALPLDDITEAMRRCINPRLSRSAIHRYLAAPDLRPPDGEQGPIRDIPNRRAGRLHPYRCQIPAAAQPAAPLCLRRHRSGHVPVYLEIPPDRRAVTAAGFLDRFRASFPLKIHTVLTDNGSEFTNRFAVDKKGKPPDKPSGQHPFGRLCTKHAFTHRLTRPFRPQTSGMVERFNRRLGDRLDRMPQNRAAHRRRFLNHAERDAYLLDFVADYNRTRLRCPDYQAPAEILAKLTGHDAKAGAPAIPTFSCADQRRRHWSDMITSTCSISSHRHKHLLVLREGHTGSLEGPLQFAIAIRLHHDSPG